MKQAKTGSIRGELVNLTGETQIPKRHLADELDEIALHCAKLPVQDSRKSDEILGYDEHELPR